LAAANHEGEASLEAFVRFALAMVRPKGSLTFVHRADRLEVLLSFLAGRAGEIVIFPLWAGEGKPAKRVLVRARKAIATPTRLGPGLVLHRADGGYTAAAEAVLRGGAPLDL
jgi:tRNA1(Val) A37 N6-methylase TrmN6